ncbi:glycogen/starch synthase [Planctomycetota bacterium]
MPLVTFYFQLHQPFRLHPDNPATTWDDMDQTVFQKVANRCYLPAIFMFADLIQEYPSFKICLSVSGTFLEQAENYRPEVIDALRQLVDVSKQHDQVEFLEETYYHSLVSLFKDSEKREFKEQVSLHRQKMHDLFGIKPSAFRNTELMYNNDVANAVADMGYRAILCEQRDDMFTPRDGQPISPNAVFRIKGRKGRSRRLLVLARNRSLSDDIAFRYPQDPLTAEQYASFIAKIDGEAVILGYDMEHIGEHISAEKGIFEFWTALPLALSRHENIKPTNPTQMAERFKDAACPMVDIHPLATSSWADVERNTYGWLGSHTQHVLFQKMQELEPEMRKASSQLRRRYRRITTSDHLYYLHEGKGPDRLVHEYFSPYGSLAAATYVLTHTLGELQHTIHNFNILKKTEQTPVVIITPESARLPSEGMGEFAKYVSGKSGGMGEVVSALCKGLSDRKIPVHLVTINLWRRFRQEAGLSEEDWIQKRHYMDPQFIHLVTSSIFEDYHSAYDGNPRENAAEFQRQIINAYLKDIRGQYHGRAIVHSHDWMAGGVLTAYAANRGYPILHTVHNTHTGSIPIDSFGGINLRRLWDRLYLNHDMGRLCVDAQATAIKNATRISYVGKKFLQEIVEDYFLDRPIIPFSVRQETKVKAAMDSALVISNGISPDLYPENQVAHINLDEPGLALTFGPNDNLIDGKRINLLKFQHQMGLRQDGNAILLYWPSRLDPSQKGVELIEDIALSFVNTYPGVQIAILGDPVGSDYTHADIMGRLACASDGRIAYHRFDEQLSLLGYAAATDVFGASLYEPFGQIDVMGNLYGATATNRDTGGYNDKITTLRLKAWGAPIDRGNGVLFKNFDSGGLWWALARTVDNHRYFQKNHHEWSQQMRRIMIEARENWSLDNMVAAYITAYEQLNGDQPLA